MRNTLSNASQTLGCGLKDTGPRQHGFHPSVRLLFGVFAAMLAFDTLSTVLVVLQFGPGMELHPMVRMASEWMGPIAGPIAGALMKAMGMIFVVHYARRLARLALPISSLLYAGAGCINLAGAYASILR